MLCWGATSIGLAAVTASGNLKIELVATGASGAAVVVPGGKQVLGVAVGTVVTYDVIARIYGSNVNFPAVVSAQGGIRSASGAGFLMGDLTHQVDAAYQVGAYSNGTLYTDGNGAGQVGPSTATFNNSSRDTILYQSSAFQPAPGGPMIRLGGGTFTVTGSDQGATTSLAFIIAQRTTLNQNPLWIEQLTTAGTYVNFNQRTGVIDAAEPLVVTTTVPEPTMASWVVVAAGLAVCRLRRV
jgi:hypothetical protein